MSNDYGHRSELVAAIAAGPLPEGTVVTVHGVVAIIDDTATGSSSALHDLGMDGVRLLGGNIYAKWWTYDSPNNHASLMKAANTYALALGELGEVKLVFEGHLRVRDQVDIGSSIDGFATDFSAAYISVHSGGDLTTTRSALIIRGRRTTHIGCTIECNKISRGWEFRNCTQSTIIGHNFRHPTDRGIWIPDSNSNAVFIKLSGYEWFNNEPEFQNDANFTASGIYADCIDFELINPSPGYCLYPIFLSTTCRNVQIINPHPYNGNPTGTARQHPFVMVSESYGEIKIIGGYYDNGYVDDRTGNLHQIGGWHYTNSAASLTRPFWRVRLDNFPSGQTQYRGQIVSFDGAVGFYTGVWQDNFGNAITDISSEAMGPISQGSGKNTTISRRRTRIIPTTTGDLDDFTAKQGDRIRERFAPGTGQSIDVHYENGWMYVASNNGTSPGNVSLNSSGSSKAGISGVGTRLDLWSNNQIRATVQDTGNFIPGADDAYNIGNGTRRWAQLYAVNGTINTSDEREKQDITHIDDAVLDAWEDVRLVQFRFRDAVTKKGDAARIHHGVIAQHIRDAFVARGLDPFAYGLLCYDEWAEIPEEIGSDGELVTPRRSAGNRYSVRMDQCLLLEMAAVRRKLLRLTD